MLPTPVLKSPPVATALARWRIAMCRAYRAQSRHHRSDFESGFAEAGPRAGWREFFMRGGHPGGRGFGGHGGDEDSGGFGVRRPLRFLAYKLELDDKQV